MDYVFIVKDNSGTIHAVCATKDLAEIEVNKANLALGLQGSLNLASYEKYKVLRQ